MDKQDQHDYGMKAGHSPIAAKVLCIDFDGTLFPWGPLMNWEAAPENGAAEAVNAFADRGFKIVVFTSRMNHDWLKFAGEDEGEQRRYVSFLLKKHGIPFHEIRGDKIPAVAYIDDKAIEYTGTNWDSIKDRVLAL